jgi:mono/diheme cytochrome c family protein
MKLFFAAMILATACFAGDAGAGKAVYDAKCKACHGADGSGKAMKLKDIREDSDADLKKSITDGWGKMKPVSSVAGPQIDDVVAYIKSLK